MPRSRVIIEVSPSLLAVSTYQGDAVLDKRERRFARGEWPANWLDALKTTSGDLNTLVQELGCKGWPCLVVYHAPGSVVGATSCASAAGTSAAIAAAKLQLASMTTQSLEPSVTSVCLLQHDKTGESDADSPQIHFVAAADTDDVATTLAGWAAAAGLSVDGLVPCESAAIVAAVAGLRSCRDQAGISASVWIGDHLGALAVGNASRLLFVRTLGIGLQALVDAMAKPTMTGATQGVAEPLSPSDARSLLFEVGIPTPQQPLPGHPGLTGAAVLPGLQPSLQRLAVEIKQSLRFGVAEEQRSEVELRFSGPGAAVPNLETSLTRLAGCRAGAVDAVASVGAKRETWSWQGVIESLPKLMSLDAGDRCTLRRTRRALGIGVGAAAMLLVLNTISAHAELASEQERLAAMRTQAGGDQALLSVQSISTDAKASADALMARVAKRLGNAPSWGAVMAVVAVAAPESVKLTEVRMACANTATSQPATCTLHGTVRLCEGVDPVNEIKTFSHALEAAPLVSKVTLGATRIADTSDGQAQTFELTLSIVGVRAEPRTPDAEAARSDQ